MGSHPHDCNDAAFGKAVAALLYARYPFHTAKQVAQDLTLDRRECTIRTAENILAGHLSAKSLTRLVRAYGLGLVIEAGAAVTGKSLDTFITEQAEAARCEQRRHEAAERRFNEQLALLRAGPGEHQGERRVGA